MKKTLILSFLIVCMAFPQSVLADEQEENKEASTQPKLVFDPDESFTWIGIAHDTADDNWGWYPDWQIMFFRLDQKNKDKRPLRFLGLEVGVCFFGDRDPSVEILFTFVPVRIGSLSFGITPYKTSYWREYRQDIKRDAGFVFTLSIRR